MCLDTLHEEATDLIRRQQTELNHFAEVNKMVVDLKTVKNDDEEILRLLVNQSVKFIPKNGDIKAIQRDAVRKFAEVMKENLQNVAKEEIMGREYYLIGLSFVDNLVKEFGKDINVSTNPEQPKEAEKETITAEHRVGDRVRVRYDLSVGDYGNVFCNANMVSQAGKILTIAKEPDSFGRYRVKECGYIWNDLMFEDELVEGEQQCPS